MKKIKILSVGISDNLGGIETYLLNIYRNIDKSKFDIKFLIFGDIIPPFYEEIKEDIFRVTNREKNYFQYIKELKEIIIKNEFDYIHMNLMSFSIFEPILIAKKHSKSKIVLHSHIADYKLGSITTKIINSIGEKLILRDENYIKCACSEKAGIDMFKKFKNKDFTVLNNGIDIEKFKYNLKNRNKIRKQLNIEKDEILIGNIGRFAEQKNHKFILKIMSKLIPSNKNIKFCLIGKGSLKNEIIEECKKLKINDKVIFIDEVINPNEYMSAFDLFLFPSLFEGLGIVLIEAQASGLKCIISDTIPNEVDLSDNIIRLNLEKDSIKKWCKTITQNGKSINRKNISEKLKEFNINETVKKVETLYLSNKE